MKNLIEELRNDERGPQDTLVDNNPHYKELQPLQFSNETELLESLSEEQKEKLEKYCDTTLEMSPYPNAKHLPRDSESPCGWRALRLRIRQMNNATQSLDSKMIKGLLLSRHTPEFPAFLGFLICVRGKLLRAIQSKHRRFRRACEGDAARSMISGRYTSELKRLSAVIQWISRAFSRVDFQAGERQCVKRPAGFTADGRADRIFSRFDRICSFFCAYRLEKGSVSSMRIFAESVCQPYARFRKQADFSPVCGRFPCVRCTHKKINISATKGVVFVSGEPWVGSP